MQKIETILLILSILILISIFFSKITSFTNIPKMLIFLAVGMIAGEEGPGQIQFNNYHIAQGLGVIALSFILFSGGLETKWLNVKRVMYRGILLSTVGVIITTGVVTLIGHFVLGLDYRLSFLIGAITSSTDASAVFVGLRSKKFRLKQELGTLLEFESGCNDPTAVFLTMTAISILVTNEINIVSFIIGFFREMLLGLFIGYGLGKLTQRFINKIKLDHDGLYPVITFAIVILSFSLADFLDGNGFLSVYVCGIIIGNSNIVHKKSLTRFHDGISWIMQVAMYVILGLVVTPSKIWNIAWYGIVISIALIVFARPISVHLILLFSKMKFKEQSLISWIGLRGAVPIVLATFPTIYNVQQSDMVFNIVFFVVLTSTLIQGSSLAAVSKKLNLVELDLNKKHFPLELNDKFDSNSELIEIIVPKKSKVIDKQIIDLNLPEKALIVLINRDEKYVIPKGDTKILEDDVLLLLSEKENLKILKSIVTE
jgi:potassium/hydrogen antiporter